MCSKLVYQFRNRDILYKEYLLYDFQWIRADFEKVIFDALKLISNYKSKKVCKMIEQMSFVQPFNIKRL